MTDYKVALAIDVTDYELIAAEVKAISDITPISLSKTIQTPDNTYCVLFWEDIHWGIMPEARALLSKLDDIRHSLISISEEGETERDVLDTDNRGCDEEFNELLSYMGDICIWSEGAPLAPKSEYLPISRDRLIQLIKSYMSWDLEGIGNDTVFYDNLIGVGFEHAEIEALGYGSCIPVDIETGIAKIVNEKYPDIVGRNTDFPEMKIFNIGFINPHKENFQGDGIANDETQLAAETLFELVNLYCEFCDENKLPYDTVTYVDLVEELKESAPLPATVPVKSCVVIKHSFDGDTPVYEYDTEEEAVAALKRLYSTYLEEEKRNNSPLYEVECYCDDDYAKITWADESTTEFVLSFTSKEV